MPVFPPFGFLPLYRLRVIISRPPCLPSESGVLSLTPSSPYQRKISPPRSQVRPPPQFQSGVLLSRLSISKSGVLLLTPLPAYIEQSVSVSIPPLRFSVPSSTPQYLSLPSLPTQYSSSLLVPTRYPSTIVLTFSLSLPYPLSSPYYCITGNLTLFSSHCPSLIPRWLGSR